MVETSKCYAKETITDNGYLDYMGAELSLFALNTETELGLMSKKLRGWAMQIFRYLGNSASGRGKGQSKYPMLGSRTKENQCDWIKGSKR